MLKKYIIITFLITATLLSIGIFLLMGKPLEVASNFIKSNKFIQEKVGEIKKIQPSIFSSIKVRGSLGEAHYKIMVEGYIEQGTVYLDLIKKAGVWTVQKGNLFVDNNNYYLDAS